MGTKLGGYMGKVLHINLTDQTTGEYPWTDEDRALYLGGKTMAARILFDNVGPDVKPFDPENHLVISTGPLSGTGAPSSSRFNVSTVSPLTGLLMSSNCGGNFGLNLKKAGYDAVVITGKSATKTRIEITEDKVEFHAADDLWGKSTSATQEALGEGIGRLVIGPAGENLVKYAAVFSDDRTAGRAGAGAVMGAKNLKAITAAGKKRPEPHDTEAMKKVYRGWVKLLQGHPLTGDALPKYGTGFLLRLMNEHHMLATHNFKRGQFEDFDMVSGQTLAARHLIKNVGCATCPIRCSRLVEIDGKRVKGPELETLGLLGPNLENNNLELIIRWNYLLDELGMDTMTTGGTIAFAMELQEKGLWDSGIEFGKTDNLAAVFEDIAYRRGIGDLLAEGTRFLSEKFGGKEFAIHSKGLELAAYEPRGAVGHGLGYATANRGGCHLNAGYLALMEGLGLSMDPYTPRAKAALCVMNQNLMEAVSSAGCCLFPLFSFYPGWVIGHPTHPISRFINKILPFTGASINLMNTLPASLLPIHMPAFPYTKALTAVTGMKIRMGEMRDIGERGFNLERMFNIARGLTEQDDALPKRLTDDPQIEGRPESRVPLARMKREYYRIRRWTESGIPTDRKKKQLRLA